jgi:hypothetical protein
MIKTALFLAAPAAALALLIQPAPAQAASPMRVFVAAQGSDANPCTFALPCRTFQHAHDTVAAEGEIDVLDPAGYGALAITKSISIQGHGFSGISVAGGATAIDITAGATGVVSLNGLLIDGADVGGTGIRFNSGASLTVANCVVRRMGGDGIAFLPSAATAQSLFISNSHFADSGLNGVFIGSTGSGAITGAIERTAFTGNLIGFAVNGLAGTGPITVSVTDSLAANGAGGSSIGILAPSSAGHSIVHVLLARATAMGNGTGLEVDGPNSTVWLTQSNLIGNTNGFAIGTGATIASYGDNHIDGNGGNVGSLGSATSQ